MNQEPDCVSRGERHPPWLAPNYKKKETWPSLCLIPLPMQRNGRSFVGCNALRYNAYRPPLRDVPMSCTFHNAIMLNSGWGGRDLMGKFPWGEDPNSRIVGDTVMYEVSVLTQQPSWELFFIPPSA